MQRLPRSSDAQLQNYPNHAYCIDGAWLKAFENYQAATNTSAQKQSGKCTASKERRGTLSIRQPRSVECVRLLRPISRLHWYMLQKVCHRDQKLSFSVKSQLVHNYRTQLKALNQRIPGFRIVIGTEIEFFCRVPAGVQPPANLLPNKMP